MLIILKPNTICKVFVFTNSLFSFFQGKHGLQKIVYTFSLADKYFYLLLLRWFYFKLLAIKVSRSFNVIVNCLKLVENEIFYEIFKHDKHTDEVYFFLAINTSYKDLPDPATSGNFLLRSGSCQIWIWKKRSGSGSGRILAEIYQIGSS